MKKPLKTQPEEGQPSVTAKLKPAVDPFPVAPPITARMVGEVSKMQRELGRLSRLRTLARCNQDVAWLLKESGL